MCALPSPPAQTLAYCELDDALGLTTWSMMSYETPLLERQRLLLGEMVEAGLPNPVFVIVHDTQGVPAVAEALGVSVGPAESVVDGVARFRLSNYLPDGDILVTSIKEAIGECGWIFVHTGCSICPEVVLELFEFIRRQEFDAPRIVVVGEYIDVVYGDERMRQLFSRNDVISLT